MIAIWMVVGSAQSAAVETRGYSISCATTVRPIETHTEVA
jgi:hypothetical protein